MRVSLFTAAQKAKLERNGRDRPEDCKPVVKIFTPDANCTWLLSEIDPNDPDLAFGLCDVGFGCPEMGNVSLSELMALRGRMRLPVERDRHFEADKSLVEYANEARVAQRIMA